MVASTDPVPRFEVLAEDVFARHNRDDRPDGQLCPSMSIGDVVMFGEVAMSVDDIGFARVDVDHADLVVDRTWRQVIDQDRAAPAPSLSRTIVSGWTQLGLLIGRWREHGDVGQADQQRAHAADQRSPRSARSHIDSPTRLPAPRPSG